MWDRSAIQRNRGACLAQIVLNRTHGGLARPALAVDQSVQGAHAQAGGLGHHRQAAVSQALFDFGEVHVMSKKVAESACILARVPL